MNTLPKVRKPVHNKCYGVEIECLINDTSPVYTAGKEYLQFWYMGRDGSIRTDTWEQRGIEFVSQPLPYDATIKQINWLAKKVEWKFNYSCGVHVHVSKAGLSFNRIRALAKGIEWMTTQQFSELFGRVPNTYCKQPFNVVSRYSCVNFTNQHTIEFRMFAGGDATWVKECVRRVKLMCSYKGKVDYASLMELFTKPETIK